MYVYWKQWMPFVLVVSISQGLLSKLGCNKYRLLIVSIKIDFMDTQRTQ